VEHICKKNISVTTAKAVSALKAMFLLDTEVRKSKLIRLQ